MTKKLYAAFSVIFLLCCGCAENPLTGKSTLALVPNSHLLPLAFEQYKTFLNESTVIADTEEAGMVFQVGQKIAAAAQKWLESEGYPHYLQDYKWEYRLINDNDISAWCMPGGKIAVYTGILPVTQSEDGLAVVMGHEVAHALLNHGQQRMSASVLRQLGALALGAVTDSQLIMGAYGIGSALFGTQPFSRKHESESDRYGLILMAIAGYNPDEAVPFWERMDEMSGGSPPEFLSTHPSHKTRIKDLRNWVPEAKQKASRISK